MIDTIASLTPALFIGAGLALIYLSHSSQEEEIEIRERIAQDSETANHR